MLSSPNYSKVIMHSCIFTFTTVKTADKPGIFSSIMYIMLLYGIINSLYFVTNVNYQLMSQLKKLLPDHN